MVYGISWDTIRADPGLTEECRSLVEKAARVLDDCRMLRYDSRSGLLACTDLGRVASHYYICHATIGVWNTMLRAHLSDSELLHVVCSAQEFEQLKVREEEAAELMIWQALVQKLSSWFHVEKAETKIEWHVPESTKWAWRTCSIR